MELQNQVVTLQEESVLNLLQEHVRSKKDSIARLQKKAQYNFTTINILAAVVAGLNIDIADATQLVEIANIRALVIFLMALIYLAVAGLSVWALWVKDRRSVPMEPTEETVEQWVTCTIEDHNKVLRESYLLVYRDIDKLGEGIALKVMWGHRLIILGILLFLVQSIIALPPFASLLSQLISGMT